MKDIAAKYRCKILGHKWRLRSYQLIENRLCLNIVCVRCTLEKWLDRSIKFLVDDWLQRRRTM
jgi:hypothetical protein